MHNILRGHSPAASYLSAIASMGACSFATSSGGSEITSMPDLTDFFTAWGIIPNEETKAFISQFEAEADKIQYLDDDSMAYRLDGKARMSVDTEINASLSNDKNSNQVTLTISNTNKVDGAMLGYEILRNGQAVGFVNAETGETTFTDTVSTVNNRVFTYSIIGYDKLLNRTAELTLKPIKISHDGSLDKDQWLIETNLISDNDEAVGDEDSTPCLPEQKAVNDLIDNNYQNVYKGSTDTKQGEFIVSLNTLADITAGRVYSAEEIYEAVWKEEAINTETIMVHVRKLREKIEANPKKPEYLKVVWGIGYKIEKGV